MTELPSGQSRLKSDTKIRNQDFGFKIRIWGQDFKFYILISGFLNLNTHRQKSSYLKFLVTWEKAFEIIL